MNPDHWSYSDKAQEYVKYAEQRERKNTQTVLRQMSTAFLVETMRDTAGKLPPKAEDLLLEAANRLESFLATSARSGMR
jgi:hypothetical protein